MDWMGRGGRIWVEITKSTEVDSGGISALICAEDAKALSIDWAENSFTFVSL